MSRSRLPPQDPLNVRLGRATAAIERQCPQPGEAEFELVLPIVARPVIRAGDGVEPPAGEELIDYHTVLRFSHPDDAVQFLEAFQEFIPRWFGWYKGRAKQRGATRASRKRAADRQQGASDVSD